MSRGPNGFVLVVVLWVLAILTIISISFWRQARLEVHAAALSVDQVQATYMARGAVHRGIAELKNMQVINAMFEQGGRISLDQRWNTHPPMLSEAPYYSVARDEDYSKDIFDYRIHDSAAKISLNLASEGWLQELDGMSRRVATEIEERRRQMREESVPRAFLALGEALQLETLDEDDWLGSPGEPGLQRLFTVWGDQQINLNTASEDVLANIPELDGGTLAKLIAFRSGPDGRMQTKDDRFIQNMGELAATLGIDGGELEPLNTYVKTTSNLFVVEGIATRRQGTLRAVCSAVVRAQGNAADVLEWRENAVGS